MRSHIAQADDSLCMVGVTTFFPFLAIFFIVVAIFATLVGLVSTTTWVGWGSSRPGGFNPNAVTLVAGVPRGGTRYHTRNSNDILGNTSVAKTY